MAGHTEDNNLLLLAVTPFKAVGVKSICPLGWMMGVEPACGHDQTHRPATDIGVSIQDWAGMGTLCSSWPRHVLHVVPGVNMKCMLHVVPPWTDPAYPVWHIGLVHGPNVDHSQSHCTWPVWWGITCSAHSGLDPCATHSVALGLACAACGLWGQSKTHGPDCRAPQVPSGLQVVPLTPLA